LTQASPLVARQTYTTNFTTEIGTYTCSGGQALPGTISTDTGCMNLGASSYLIGEIPGGYFSLASSVHLFQFFSFLLPLLSS